jgi:hypothetical protein
MRIPLPEPRARVVAGGARARVALLLLLMGGCGVAVPAAGRLQAPTSERPSSLLDSDDERVLLEIAGRVPGFAGFEIGERGLQIYLVDLGERDAAEREVRPLLAIWRPGVDVTEAEFVPVRFAYDTLVGYRDRLPAEALHGVGGVVAVGIDVARNRVVLEVASERSRGPVERIVSDAGIPMEAVSIVVTGPVIF